MEPLGSRDSTHRARPDVAGLDAWLCCAWTPGRWCPGTVVAFTAEGEGGGTWYMVGTAAGWELDPAPPPRPAACEARTTVDGALKLYARDPSAPSLTWHGDHEIAGALAGVKAVLGLPSGAAPSTSSHMRVASCQLI